MKTALVYDRVNKWGGAERVLLALHEMFPDAPMYTSVYVKGMAAWADVFPQVHTSFLQKLPFAKSNHEWFAPLMPVAFEQFNFDDYDLVISVTSEAAKGIITKPHTKHVCYCLTPTRYLWSGYDDYFKGLPLKGVAGPFVKYLKNWDKVAAHRPDKMIAISTEVRERIKKYYQRDSELVYPPVDIEKFQIKKSNIKMKTKNAKFEKYFLIVSRLVSYKKVDLAIQAFNDLGLPLVIIGKGKEERKLKSIAKKNIKFEGFVDDDVLPLYYQNANALIFPQEEDFGIVPVEAQAAGIPVIAYNKGGALDTVIDGKTGLFFEEQTANSLKQAVKKFDKMSIRKEDCVGNAKKFTKEKFKNNFLKSLVDKKTD
jgi:glycosyltransferase involved in cell wall biosynthesis